MFKHLVLLALLCYTSMAMVMYDTRFGNESIAQSVINAMNTSVDPCDDFYQYACGSWLANATIPEDAARFSRSFDGINKKNFAVLRDILENDFSINASLKKFFTSCMDMHAIEVGGTGVLDTYLSFIDSMVENPATGSWPNAWKLIGFMHSVRMFPFFEFHVEIDAKDPTQYLGTFGQSGITLPDRNFYLDASLSGLRDQYKAHMVKMFNLLNMTNAAARADAVLQLETSLANIFVPGADLRDPFKVYNKKSLDELRDLAAGVNWDNYLRGATLDGTTTFNVIAPQYLQQLSNLLAQVPLETVGYYLKWVFIHEVADYLPARFVNETFNFFGKVLLGEEEMPIRTTTCIESTDDSMGFLLAQYFVQRVFPGASKTTAANLIRAIEDVFSTTLKGDAWMDDTTRQRALEKLSMVKDMIGYPDVWPTYDFSVTESYIRNKMAARLDSFSKQKEQLGKPVSHDQWGMTPSTVNAYYEPTMNVMVFPAAILQNPFFDLQFPKPLNFGGIGMVMGHELSHGFDDQGRLYTGTGKLENWWTPLVNENFKAKATCLVNQYNGFSPLPGYHVNGNLTLGENIADNAGIKDAYKALEATLGPAMGDASIVQFLSNAQLFFVGFAQTWCSKARDEFVKQRLLTDVHSPPMFRVIGPLSNLKQFASTFNCKAGARMNPDNKCELF